MILFRSSPSSSPILTFKFRASPRSTTHQLPFEIFFLKSTPSSSSTSGIFAPFFPATPAAFATGGGGGDDEPSFFDRTLSSIPPLLRPKTSSPWCGWPSSAAPPTGDAKMPGSSVAAAARSKMGEPKRIAAAPRSAAGKNLPGR